MKVTFKVSDGVFGKAHFDTFADCKDWFDSCDHMEFGNVTIEVSTPTDTGCRVSSTFLMKLDKRK